MDHKRRENRAWVVCVVSLLALLVLKVYQLIRDEYIKNRYNDKI